MSSSVYTTPGRRSTPFKAVPEGPIQDFSAVIDESPVDAWQKRATAFEQLVALIPEDPHESDPYNQHAGNTFWYNSPPTLRHLANPVAALLRDARSTVVKRTCACLGTLFQRCRTDARYFLKDLMPTILSVHGQTVQIIRQAVQNMILECLPLVPCKSVMPLFMERLKIDKSRTVREACSLYLSTCLGAWNEPAGYLTDDIWMQVGRLLVSSARDPSPQVRQHCKTALTTMHTTQGNLFHNLLQEEIVRRDPKLRRWLEALQRNGDDDEGNGAGANFNDELSFASKRSYSSDMRNYRGVFRSSPSTRNYYNRPSKTRSADNLSVAGMSLHSRSSHHHYNNNSSSHTGNNNNNNIPKSIAVAPNPSKLITTTTNNGNARKPLSGNGNLGPPLRNRQHHATLSTQSVSSSSDSNLGSPTTTPKPTISRSHSTPIVPNEVMGCSNNNSRAVDLEYLGNDDDDDDDDNVMNTQRNNGENSPTAAAEDQGPFIASMEQLKRQARSRRSRNSLLMQARFRNRQFTSGSLATSGNSLGGNQNTSTLPVTPPPPNANVARIPAALVPDTAGSLDIRALSMTATPDTVDGTAADGGVVHDGIGGAATALLTPPPSTGPPEHMIIAIRLLRAHKTHVDSIMETLRMEMDALKDFDNLLEQAGRPVEDEVLDYFESVGLCLDQRVQAANQLQAELNRIGQGPS